MAGNYTVAQSIKLDFDKNVRCEGQNVYRFDCFMELCLEKCTNHYNDDECTWNCVRDQFADYQWHVFEFEDQSKLRLMQGYDPDVGAFERCEVV